MTEQKKIELTTIPTKERFMTWPEFWRDVVIPYREDELRAALTRIEELTEQVEKMPKWISVKEGGYPKTGQLCWIVWSGTIQHVAYRRAGIGYACAEGYEWISAADEEDDAIPDKEVTHWQPLPSPPAEGDQG